MHSYKEILNINYDRDYPEDCLLDLYIPQTDKPCPVLLYFHGGGLESGSRKAVMQTPIGLLPQDGIALISIDYRMYPRAEFPDFLEDAAKAVAWAMKEKHDGFRFNKFYLGGVSAGAYISMMLYFDERYLGKYAISPNQLEGCLFDGGQPTVHFNVLRERGVDTRAVRLDDAAPLYFIDKTVKDPARTPRFLIFTAENDIPGRVEQTQLLLKTMKLFGYDENRITFHFMKGFSHCQYIEATDNKGESIYYPLLRRLIQ